MYLPELPNQNLENGQNGYINPINYIFQVCIPFLGSINSTEWANENIQQIIQAYSPYMTDLMKNLQVLMTSYTNPDPEVESRIKHDLRSPIGMIVSAVRMLSGEQIYTDSEAVTSLVKTLLKNLSRVTSLIHGAESSKEGVETNSINVISFTKTIAGGDYRPYINPELNPEDKVEVHSKIHAYINENPQAELKSAPFVVANNIIELVINAVKYGATDVRIEVLHVNNYLVFKVVDNGMGIDPERLNEVNAALASNNGVTSVGPQLGFETTSTGRGLIASRSANYALRLHSEGLGKGTTAIAAVRLAVPAEV